MHASTSAQEPNGLLTKNGRRQPSHGGTGWRGEGDRRGVRRPRRVRGWWLRDDALHMRDGGRAAAETDGARWPVVRAARNSHALLVGRTDDRHIDTRAVGAGAVAGHTGAGEGAAREPGDIGDGPMIAGVADEGDQAAWRLHRHVARATSLRLLAARPNRRVGGTNGGEHGVPLR